MNTEIKKLIQELEGVVSCNLTGTDEIEEIHIIADKKREPKRIVRDVETVCLVNKNFKIDHKKISIARIDGDFSGTVENFSSSRIELVSIYIENNRSCCSVKMKINEQEIEESFEAQIGENTEKLIARSVINILNNYLQQENHLVVEDVFTINGKEELVIAQISNYDQNNKLIEKFVGAVYLDNNIALAIAKASLKAVNRRLNY